MEGAGRWQNIPVDGKILQDVRTLRKNLGGGKRKTVQMTLPFVDTAGNGTL
jgi:hypothetical protein